MRDRRGLDAAPRGLRVAVVASVHQLGQPLPQSSVALLEELELVRLPASHLASPAVAELVESDALRAIEAEQVEHALGQHEAVLATRLRQPAAGLGLDQLQAGEGVVEEDPLGEAHALGAAVALVLALVGRELAG